jgi:hypothetical protein
MAIRSDFRMVFSDLDAATGRVVDEEKRAQTDLFDPEPHGKTQAAW